MATLREMQSSYVSGYNSVTVEDGENGFWWQPELCTTWRASGEAPWLSSTGHLDGFWQMLCHSEVQSPSNKWKSLQILSFNWPDQRLRRGNRRVTTEGNSFSVILKGFIFPLRCYFFQPLIHQSTVPFHVSCWTSPHPHQPPRHPWLFLASYPSPL